jgi:hypothetical protein
MSVKIDTFWTRLESMVSISNPRFLLTSDESIRAAEAALKNPQLDAESRKQHQLLVSATVNQATGNIIPWVVRIAGIAPVNIPLIWAMLICPASNVPGTLFLHWVNQSYNAYTNFHHRAGKDFDFNASLKSYGLAVGSACSLAYGLGKAAERAPPSLKRLGILIPCIATAAANVSNVAFMRLDEVFTGTQVRDADGKEYGKSVAAGITGVAQTAGTRAVLLPTACLLFPPAMEALAAKVNLLPKSFVGLTTFRLTFIYIALQAALPAALAVFPQTITYKVEELEEPFRHLIDANGKPITTLYSNKGL